MTKINAKLLEALKVALQRLYALDDEDEPMATPLAIYEQIEQAIEEAGGGMNPRDMEVCCECGNSVASGSNRWVNRVPELNDLITRSQMGRPYPFGGWVCAECDAAFTPSKDMTDLAEQISKAKERGDLKAADGLRKEWFRIRQQKKGGDLHNEERRNQAGREHLDSQD